jgi:hypothetical protein
MTMVFPSLKTPGATMPIHMDAALATGGSLLDTAFHDLIDVINPLQHLPVVGTLYRAITGEHIGTIEKIAGDALYGGLWGAVSSVADTAFEAVTGKNFGSTVLALLTGGDAEKIAPAPVAVAAAAIPPAASNDVDALSRAMAAKGVDADTAARALDAYRKATMVAVGG